MRSGGPTPPSMEDRAAALPMKPTEWTARDFAKLLGILFVVAVAASIAVPTASYNLGISFESDLYRILGFSVALIAMSTLVMWTVHRRKKSPLVLVLGAGAAAMVIVISIFLFILG